MEYKLWSVEELIKTVCASPKSVWSDGNFFNVASFIEGYIGGRGQPYFDEFTEFRKWVSDKYYKSLGISRSTPWYICIKMASDLDLEKSEFEILYKDFNAFKIDRLVE